MSTPAKATDGPAEATSTVLAAPPPPAEPEWHQLNPVMLIIHPAREIIRLIPVFVGLLVFGGKADWKLWIALAAVLLLVIRGLLHWLSTRYRITSDHVELHSGVIVKKRRSVPRDRIRTVDIKAEWQHRLFSLGAVRIGTGRHDQGKSDELILDAVTLAEAERLRTELLHRPIISEPVAMSTGQPQSIAEDTVLATVRKKWTLLAPFTLSGLATIGVFAGAAYHILENELHVNLWELGPLQNLFEVISQTPVWIVVMFTILALVVIATLASVAGYILSYWNFRLSREKNGTLHIKHGLITTRSVSIEEKRLRGVEIKEPLPLRMVRGGRCMAVVSGLRTGRGDERAGGILLPTAPLAEAHRVASVVLRENPDPTTTPLISHPRAALPRRMTRAVVAALVIVAGLVLGALVNWLPDWAWQASLVLVPLSVLVGWDRYRSLGHALTERYVVTRGGSFVRETVALRSEGVIGWRMHGSLFQRRAGLRTLVATTAAGRGSYHITDVDTGEALRVIDTASPGLADAFRVNA